MSLRASTVTDLRQQLAAANDYRQPIDQVDISPLNRVLEHNPEDLVVTVETGLTMAALNQHLRRQGQWLPVDPPRPRATTIADVLNGALSGPRRFGYGTIREYLLGIAVVLADGRLVRSGGKVVKNVAGYDLCKLFVGSQGTLGVPVEASFKLLPLPEKEAFVACSFPSTGAAMHVVQQLLTTSLTPTILDLHHPEGSIYSLVVGVAGATEEVAWQLDQLDKLRFSALRNLAYADSFANPQLTCHSVLPSRLAELLDSLKEVPFLARAGNGIVYAQGGPAPSRVRTPVVLQQRVKELFDPHRVLPPLPWC